MGYFSAKNSAYSMVPTCNWHYFVLPFLLLLDIAVILSVAVILVLFQGYLTITMKCHLKQNDHSFIILSQYSLMVNFHIMHT